MKLPSVYTDVCFKQVFIKPTASHNSPCHSVMNSVESPVAASADCSCSSRLKVVLLATHGSKDGVYDK